jgi:UDPglucose 6-dehydrogenase
MKITIIGSGYVGLVAGACFAELGHTVRLVDNDPNKLDRLNAGECPIHEALLPELLAKHRGKRLSFTNNLRRAVRDSRAVFIAVGTPDDGNGRADLSYVESVSREVANAITEYTVIVEKSTVPVMTSDRIRQTLLLNGADPDLFDVASNPEFLKEGTAVQDFLAPDRIVVGTDSSRAIKVLREIYAPMIADGHRFIETSTKSAELIKHASNAFLAMKISFVNAVASVCEQVGTDVTEVIAGIGSDTRIGSQFLKPGIGYGGSCFPKDLKAFKAVAEQNHYQIKLLEEVSHINGDQQKRFLSKVKDALWTLRGKRLAVLGLAFKGGTDDIRESPAVSIIQALLKEGCRIVAYDPAAMDNARKGVLDGSIEYATSPYAAARKADALLILTDWKEFAELHLDQLELNYPLVIDGRNLYDPQVMADSGFTYYSVGRPVAVGGQLKSAASE